jgi:hypothetical protein
LRRGKRHDYFTSALLWPQKGPGVELPLNGNAPVRTFANGKLFDGIVLPGEHNETGKDARLRYFNDGELRFDVDCRADHEQARNFEQTGKPAVY